MKIAISTAALILLFDTTTAYARQEAGKGQEGHQQQAKPEHQEAKPAKQREAKPAQPHY